MPSRRISLRWLDARTRRRFHIKASSSPFVFRSCVLVKLRLVAMISVGDLVAVQTTRPEFNSRVYRVESFTASTPRRVVVASTDDDTPKRISIREECCTALAIVPFAQTPTTQSPTAQCQLQPLAQCHLFYSVYNETPLWRKHCCCQWESGVNTTR